MAILNIKINSQGAKVGAKQVNDSLDKISNKAKKTVKTVDSRFNSLKKTLFSLKGGFVGLAAGFGAAMLIKNIIMVGSAFEKTMKIVKGVSRATNEELILMNNLARKLGENTEFSATQSAQGLKFLTMAGISVDDAIKALPGTLDLATAGVLDLSSAADIASNAMTSMGMNASQLGRINDSFINTTTRSNSTVAMLAESFKYAAPTANALGYQIERVNAFLGKLHDAGIQGSMAGTQLNQALLRGSKVMGKLNMGEGKDLIDLLTKIKDEQWGVNKIMGEFAGRGGRAILILKEMVPELKALEKAQLDSAGAAKKLADTMRDTTEGAIKELQSTIESVKLDVFEKDAGGVKEAIQELTKHLRENKDVLAEAGANLSKFATNLAGLFADALTVASPLLEIFNRGLTDAQKGFAMLGAKSAGIDFDLFDKLAEDPALANVEQNLRNVGEEIESLEKKIKKFQDRIYGGKSYNLNDKISQKELFEGHQLSEQLKEKYSFQRTQEKVLADLQKQRNIDNIIAEDKKLKIMESEADVWKNFPQYEPGYISPEQQKIKNDQVKAELLQYDITQKRKEALIDIKDFMNESLDLLTEEEKKLKEINDWFDEKEKALKKEFGIEVSLSKERANAIDQAKEYLMVLGEVVDLLPLLKDDSYSLTNMFKDFEGQTSDINEYRGKVSDKLSSGISEGVKDGFSEGLSGVLQSISGKFMNQFSDMFTSKLKSGLSSFFTNSGISDKLIGIANTAKDKLSGLKLAATKGGILSSSGGLTGAAMGGGAILGGLALGFKSVSDSQAKDRKEMELLFKRLMGSLDALSETIKKETITLERRLSADYESSQFSESILTALNKHSETIKAAADIYGKRDQNLSYSQDEKLRVNYYGTIKEENKRFGLEITAFYKDFLDDQRDFLDKYGVQEMSARQKRLNELEKDANQQLKGFIDIKTTGVDFEGDALMNILDKFNTDTGGAIEQALADNEMPIAWDPLAGGDLYEMIFPDFVKDLENLQATLANTDISEVDKLVALINSGALTPEDTQAAIDLWGDIYNAMMTQARLLEEEIKGVVNESARYLSELKGETNALDDSLAETNKKYNDWEKSIWNLNEAENSLSEERSVALKLVEDSIRAQVDAIKNTDVDTYLRDLRGEITPLETALTSMNSQFNNWEDNIKGLTGEEESLKAQRREAENAIGKLYDSEGNLIDQTETLADVSDKLNDSLFALAGNMKKLKDDTFDKIFEDIEFKESGLAREDWVKQEIDRLFSLPSLTEDEFKKSMSYVEEWYRLSADSVDQQTKVVDGWKEVSDKIQTLVNSISSAQRDIKYSDLNLSLPFDKFSEALPDYNKLFTAAKTGDESSINEYLSFASKYLQVAQDTYKSSQDYQGIYEQVMTDMNDLNAFVQSTDYEERIFNESQITNTELLNVNTNLASTNNKLLGVKSEMQQLSAKADKLSVTIDGTVAVHIVGSDVAFGSGIGGTETPNFMKTQAWDDALQNWQGLESGTKIEWEGGQEWEKLTGSLANYTNAAGNTYTVNVADPLALAERFPEIAKQWQEDLPGFATGGIANTPQIAKIAENGPEAFVPLQNGVIPVKMMNFNQPNNQPQTIIINVAGKEFYADVKAIADEVRVDALRVKNAPQRRLYRGAN